MIWRRKCEHLRTRCIHGQEIIDMGKYYIVRFWKEDVVRRQMCLDCGKPLDRKAICTATGEDVHIWIGYWSE